MGMNPYQIKVPAYWSPWYSLLAVGVITAYHLVAGHYGWGSAFTFHYFLLWLMTAGIIYLARYHRYVPSLKARVLPVTAIVSESANAADGELCLAYVDHRGRAHQHTVYSNSQLGKAAVNFLPYKAQLAIFRRRPEKWYFGDLDEIDDYLRYHRPYRTVIHDTPDIVGLLFMRIMWATVVPLMLWLLASCIL